MSVIGSLGSSFLSVPEVIHYAALPIQPNSRTSNTRRILSRVVLCLSMMIVDLVKSDPRLSNMASHTHYLNTLNINIS